METVPKIISLTLAILVLLFAVICFRLSATAKMERSDAADHLRLISVLAVVACISVLLFIFSF